MRVVLLMAGLEMEGIVKCRGLKSRRALYIVCCMLGDYLFCIWAGVLENT